MKVAIMQPTYMPWLGYFRLISEVDAFVYLDDAQYERGTWHNRNKILLQGSESWLTVPVVRKHLGDSLNTVLVDDTKRWRNKHLAMLRSAYAKAPYLEDMLDLAAILQDNRLTHLSDLNIGIIEKVCQFLSIVTPRLRSSSLNIPGVRTKRVVEICSKLHASTYVSPRGAENYLREDGFTSLTSIRLEFHDFHCKSYRQLNTESFKSHMSVLDVAANLGWPSVKKVLFY